MEEILTILKFCFYCVVVLKLVELTMNLTMISDELNQSLV